jgi:hypothetical protein
MTLERLEGGNANRGRVVRVGSTVHRPRGHYSAAVHALLAHLAASGFGGSPRLVSHYDRTEVLTYLDGQAANQPTPEWALTPEALVSVGVLLRDYHRHAASFASAGLTWQRPLPAAWQGSLITHNDTHPANVVFRDGRAVALIDFDLAGPGCVAWELSVAACFWSPLLAEQDVEDSRQGQALSRFRLLLDAYGLPAALRPAVVDATVEANRWISTIIEEATWQGHAAFIEVWAAWGAKYQRAHDWLLAHRDQLLSAALA